MSADRCYIGIIIDWREVAKRDAMNISRYFLPTIALFLSATALVANESHHAMHDQITPAQFSELRDKVPLYREFSDAQIIENMQRMGPNFHVYLSDVAVKGDIGVLALGHGYSKDGNEIFKQAFASTADKFPTAVSFGMAMMTSDPIQAAVDELVAAGADKVVVLPITTLKVGGLIGQWLYIFNARADAPWMSVPRVGSDADIVVGATPTTDPLISKILFEQAIAQSRISSNEVVALVAHGPDNAAANKQELEILAQHADYIQTAGNFAEARGFTLQDDAPTSVRAANVDRLRGWVSVALESGKDVIVLTTLPVYGSVHKKIVRDLDGLDYSLVERGVMEHPLFGNWVESAIAAALD